MRVFSIASWAHFGSLVVSIAMFGFGVVSAVMVIAKGTFDRHWGVWCTGALLSFGPLMVAANTLAQMYAFNPIFLISDPAQMDRLVLNFVLYFLPFVPGALFLGLVFLRGQKSFGKVYFANMGGSGLGGLAFLLCMYVVFPDDLILVPLAMWAVAGTLWFVSNGQMVRLAVLLVLAAGSAVAAISLPQIVVSEYKGVSYARAFPDSERVYEAASPLGYVEVYHSTYFHFAPGLSDMAALNMSEMPSDAFLGMYFDSSGPVGIMRELPESQQAYFRFLPMYQPFVLHPDEPSVFVVQLGGGISTQVALAAGARQVTVAESNPMVLDAVRDDPFVAEWTGRFLDDPRVTVVPYEGRLFAANTDERFDIIDFSLPDSTGLSSPGGISVFEQYAYTEESMAAYMRALSDDGVLAVTIWNRENPPKAVLRLFSTMAAAARDVVGGDIADHFFVNHTYLSTVTVMFSRGGFDVADTQALTQHSSAMAFDVLYAPGQTWDRDDGPAIFQAFNDLYFDPERLETEGADVDMSATTLYRLVWSHLIADEAELVSDSYIFDVGPLTNDQPYFAGYIKTRDMGTFAGMLDAVSDQWGYLLLWATLALASAFGLLLLVLPMIFGWRTIFSRQPGKLGVVVYFFGLGLGYIVVEIALISKFVLALANPTISASVLITGMLVFSGLGSYLSGRFLDRARTVMPKIFVAIAALIVLFALGIDPLLDVIGVLPNWLRIIASLAVLFPLAFLMGFPFATGMASLSRLNKEHFFLWAWGINGSFSVVGAVLVPIVGVVYGLSVVLLVAAASYLICWPAFYGVLAERRAEGVGAGAVANPAGS
ncbi:MAG: hypothetical protein KDA64_05265 [Rhodospirillaceae bacterium]|nr:hypothetical protein [Rhodospirillaceae bacterium]